MSKPKQLISEVLERELVSLIRKEYPDQDGLNGRLRNAVDAIAELTGFEEEKSKKGVKKDEELSSNRGDGVNRFKPSKKTY